MQMFHFSSSQPKYQEVTRAMYIVSIDVNIDTSNVHIREENLVENKRKNEIFSVDILLPSILRRMRILLLLTPIVHL